MSWTTSDRVIALRERSPVIDIAVETLDGWRRHLSSRNASVLAFWSFLSIFPALLAATTILGFVLQNNEQLQQDIEYLVQVLQTVNLDDELRAQWIEQVNALLVE